jgi:drug/metabolite transporter (DMT)-like permease
MAVLRAEPVPSPADVAWALGAGVAGGIGITALYGGLAAGRMGVVAPVTGLIAATIPVLVGTVVEGLPRPLVAVGIGVALVAVVLVGRTHDPEDGPSGLPYGLLAGAGIGAFNVFVAQFGEGRVFGPFTIVRLVEVVLIGAVILVARRPWRLARPLLAPVALVGVLDTAGNAFFIGATQFGRLDVAAVLSSLYPVTTVILAIVLLRERVTPSHALGIGLAAVAVGLIAGG